MVEKYLVSLSLVSLVGAISYMVVAPSIVFYVLEVGGSKEEYGIILSAFSFSSFCAKPFLGAWSDRAGFRIPYTCSLALSACGGVLYLLASLCEKTTAAIAMILCARLLGGIGGASATLKYAYLARVIPNDQHTKINSLLGSIRIVGMAAGPGVNVLLDKIDFSIGRLHINPLNSVGLVLLGSNVLALTSILLLLDDPSPEDELHRRSSTSSESCSLFTSCFCAEILVPIITIFGINANFQLIETGLAPAANHALGWGPIETSAVLGSMSVVIFVVMLVVYELSSYKVPDEYILLTGLCVSAVGYTLIYFSWYMGAHAWQFYVPMILSVGSLPCLGAPSRSIFSKEFLRKPGLAERAGTMQAVLSMSASVAGFVTPGLVAAYVLRSPAQVESSRDHRELSPRALFAPGLSLVAIVGYMYIAWKQRHVRPTVFDEEDGAAADEITHLKQQPRRQFSRPGETRYSCHDEAHRRQSACLMDIPQTSMLDEHDHHLTKE